ncbi:hypothetical protein [Halovulum sp. GXIMD14793]
MWDWFQRLGDTPIPTWLVLSIALPLLGVLLYVAYRQQNPPQGPALSWLEEQIELLAAAGVQLRPGVGLYDLLAQHPASHYRRQPALVLHAYGGLVERDRDWHPLSDQVTHFDYECVDDPKCYDDAVFTPLTDLLPPEVPRSIRLDEDGRLEMLIGHRSHRLTPQGQ